jgi:hypothetical protein
MESREFFSTDSAIDKSEVNEVESVEFGPIVEELEALFLEYITEEILEPLNTIQTEEEARSSAKREAIREPISRMVKMLYTLKHRTAINKVEYDKLYERYMILSRAMGIINNGRVDHDR